ncbi:MAG: hypothetical protein ABJP82_20680, partial [Hyphomicrobiales bacterium]
RHGTEAAAAARDGRGAVPLVPPPPGGVIHVVIHVNTAYFASQAVLGEARWAALPAANISPAWSLSNKTDIRLFLSSFTPYP